MNRYFSSFLFASLLGISAAACGGGNGDSALLSAFPDQGFAGRTTTLMLVGEATDFSDASTVDFGEGVTVNSVEAVGSTGLRVEIAADIDAPLGPRTISVDGQALEGGFEIASPIEVEVLGTPAQGSMSTVRVTNLDVLHPFDLTQDDEGNFLNLATSVDGAGSAPIFSAAPFELELTLQLDLDAAPGETAIQISSGPGEEALISRTSVEVAETTPMALEAGTVSGSVDHGFDSVLYELSVSDLTAVLLTVPETPTGGAFLQVLGPSGSFENAIGFSANTFFGPLQFSNNLQPDDTIYVILWEGIDEAGYDYSFEADVLAAPETVEHSDDNNDMGQAQLVPTPGGVINATFDGETDEDWYAVEITGDDEGKAITVITGGFSSADPMIDVFEPDGTTALVEEVDDFLLPFDRVTTPATSGEGTYFVRIRPSPAVPTVSEDSDHTVVITLDDPPSPL